MSAEQANPFESFFSENGHYLVNARAKMDHLIHQHAAFWNQTGSSANPAVMAAGIKALNDAYILYIEGLRELQLYQIELKKFLGVIRDVPNIDETPKPPKQEAGNDQEPPRQERRAVGPPSGLPFPE